MLRMTLDIVPFGEECLASAIVMLEISRTTARADPEDYNVIVYAADGELVNIFRVREHRYAAGAQELVRRALGMLCPPEAR